MMTALMTERNPMKIMWNQEKVGRSVQMTLRRVMIAAVKWTLLTVVSTGRDRTKCGNTPLKSSMLGKSCGYDALEKQMERSGAKIAGDNSREHTRRRVAEAFAGAPTGSELRERLRAHHIDLYIRRNEGGRITGATFIDHENRCVLNGSRLGKEYSANALQERFGTGLTSGADLRTVPATPDTPQIRPAQRRTVIKKKKPKMGL